METATATTRTTTPSKCSVQRGTLKAKTPSLIRCGAAKTGTWLIKSATALGKPNAKRNEDSETLRLLHGTALNFSPESKPGGVVAKHRGLWSPRREFESLPGYFRPRINVLIHILLLSKYCSQCPEVGADDENRYNKDAIQTAKRHSHHVLGLKVYKRGV